MKLWERSGPLAQLEELLHDSGRAGMVALVAGEAGIGKSALVATFASQCRARARLLLGVCDPLVTPRALGPLHDIGRQVGGRLAELLDAGADRTEVLGALVVELAGPRQRRRPVVVVEDAHWADEATMDLLVFLSRRIDRLAALLVVTYRDDEVGPDHPLRVALAAMPRAVVRRIPVLPLSEACVADQATSAGRDAVEVYRLTGGNPLLVTEVLAGGSAVPDTVRDLVLARLRGLPEPARELARLVSVIPTRAEPAVLIGREAAVEGCIAAGVLVPAGDGVAYRHELLRRAVEESLSPVSRAALHREALGLLAGVDGIDPARLVHHARLGGKIDAVLRHGMVAAARAAGQGSHRESVAHYRAVAPHAARLPPAERAELLEAYAVQAYLAGVSTEGLDACRAALREWTSLGERDRIGRCLRWISRLAWWSGQGGPAREAAAEAVVVLRAGLPDRELAMAFSNRSQLHMLAHELEAALEWGERARLLADSLGDAETALHASVNMATARVLSGDVTAADELRRIHRSAAAAGLTDHAARALVNRSSSLLELADYNAAAAALDEALSYATGEDLDGYVQYLLGLRAMIRLERLDWEGALTDAHASLSRPIGLGVAVVPALVVKGRILSAGGSDGALATLDTAAAHAYGLDELQWIGPVASARAEYFLMVGEPERAVAEARPAWELASARGHSALAAELAFRCSQAGGAAGEPDGEPVRRPEPYLSLIGGDWSGAAAAWAARGRGYARLEALSYGDRTAVTEVLTVLDRLGAVRAAARLRAALRRRGVTGVPRGPRLTTTTNAAGLTARQAEVLRLLAQGLSNTDIAARLTLSTKTVEHHISAVLAKLGVTSRGQAVAAAHGRHLLG
ncbi:helix-turn-helix transcriptional regulator [Rugosimonospora africana]|uniref:LuxR family transcriptional regulator n=1 Tax=Rugosimonospora africana TaxID=556532 RepID=A0A8J3VVP6_9ACTN|nr:LuxR family transcriptional regulator [Rugosimonospora africana]GIH20530.1 LuxR family transcriptional regulator [Rugosimonospora africana]